MRAAVVVAALVALVVPASAQAVELGAADDRSLVAAFVPDTIASMDAHGVQNVRLVAVQGRSLAYPLQAALAAHRRRMHVTVVLTRWNAENPDGSFAGWAADTARRFAAAGADRFSILNEPDLWLRAGDRCDTDLEVHRALAHTGRRLTRARHRVQRRQWRRVRIRKGGKLLTVRRHVRVWKVRHRRRVPVWTVRKVRVVEPVRWSTDDVTVTPRYGCLLIAKARLAAQVLRAAVPAVRAAAPLAEVGGLETSPVPGVSLFVDELARQRLPSLDFVAHHPYTGGGYAEGGADKPGIVGLTRKLHDLAPEVDWTECGTQVRTGPGAHTLTQARALWSLTMSSAALLRVRSVIAYGWWPTGSPSWDTAASGVVFDQGIGGST